LENGETAQQGAERETLEEAGARVTLVRLFAVFSLPHVNQVYLIFLADLDDLDFRAGEESLEVQLVARQEVPWDRIAFRAIEFALDRYFFSSSEEVHLGAYERRKDDPWIRGPRS
jgi:ADP-ribose pyrophosphatase YjhB (NUDIX family)